MKQILFLAIIAFASCSTPGPVTGRVDPGVTGSGTLGSVKSTDRAPDRRLPAPKLPTQQKDSLPMTKDTLPR
ncbi:MAG TPA: hypothetical protein VK563_04090 [Puia sp.]|nr:hypothetical protein [Puia sp.]